MSRGAVTDNHQDCWLTTHHADDYLVDHRVRVVVANAVGKLLTAVLTALEAGNSVLWASPR
ncbi:MAG: hypothetical protein V5A38_06800 [Halolamina sp.]|uniref:hypothetical protein n=1 Tax=Halolamina sp. TaxID=1940283 RepID=UPI002FC3207E